MDEKELIQTLAEQATEIRKNNPISPEDLGYIKYMSILGFSGLAGCLDVITNVVTSKEEITELVKNKSWRTLAICKMLFYIILGCMYLIIKSNTSLIKDDSAIYYIILVSIAITGISKASVIFTNFISKAQEDANTSVSRVFGSVADKVESIFSKKGSKNEDDNGRS